MSMKEVYDDVRGVSSRGKDKLMQVVERVQGRNRESGQKDAGGIISVMVGEQKKRLGKL